MALILNIDTATENASVALCDHAAVLSYACSDVQREHASFLHLAIEEVLGNAGKHLQDLDAVAVTSGPGSYTGLRVGMATAKGFCYSLGKPLILVGTLEVMASAAVERFKSAGFEGVFCPMIDARRMEVFTAVYDQDLLEVMPPAAMILSPGCLSSYVVDKKIILFGSGSQKFRDMADHENMTFVEVSCDARHLGAIADQAFRKGLFADTAYAQPNYIKEFFTVAKPGG